MVLITEALMRKRAEHNEGSLADLKEITLHQYDIEKIENLDKFSRNLEIVYLQSNLIKKLENLHRLKCLQYLNVAVNNIEKIENISRCESLHKLDLTANFVWDLLSFETLQGNVHLEDLHMIGNPCTDYDGWRSFLIGTLPQLLSIDGSEITRTERIAAEQELKGGLRDRIAAAQAKYEHESLLEERRQRDEMMRKILAEKKKEEEAARAKQEKQLAGLKGPSSGGIAGSGDGAAVSNSSRQEKGAMDTAAAETSAGPSGGQTGKQNPHDTSKDLKEYYDKWDKFDIDVDPEEEKVSAQKEGAGKEEKGKEPDGAGQLPAARRRAADHHALEKKRLVQKKYTSTDARAKLEAIAAREGKTVAAAAKELGVSVDGMVEEEEEEVSKSILPDRVLQRNETDLDWRWEEHPRKPEVSLLVKVPRYLDSSLIDVDVHPGHVKLTIKKKVLLLSTPAEVRTESMEATRSEATGLLRLRMRLAQDEPLGMYTKPEEKRRPRRGNQGAVKKEEAAEAPKSNYLEVPDKAAAPGAKYDSIVADNAKQQARSAAAQRRGGIQEGAASQEEDESDFEDDPDCPPLV